MLKSVSLGALKCTTRFSVFLPPATKLRQGNVFTPICQSFCSQGGMHGWGCAWQGGSCGGGVCDQGVCVWSEGMHGWGCALRGGMHGGDVHDRGHAWQGGMRGRRDGHCSRRYASYWNAFLLW